MATLHPAVMRRPSELVSPNQDPAALNTISKSGTPPKERISSAGQAQTIVQYQIDANRTRAAKEAMVRGMFDGNAPYNAHQLRARGEAWKPNFNSLEAKGRAASAKVPYYDLFGGAPTYITMETALGENEDQRLSWSRIITEELDFTLKAWPRFDFAISTMIDDYIKYGRGMLMWQDPHSWPFRRISQDRCLVNDGESIDIDDELEVFTVRQKFKAHQLYKYIRNESAARDTGWNPPEVIRAIWEATPDMTVDPWRDPITMQQRLKDADLYVTAHATTINTARVYVKEFNGKISELMVLEYGVGNRKEGPSEFLFKHIGRYDNYRQVFCPLFFDMEDGSWHGSSGLGKDLFSTCQTKDRFWMNVLAGATMRSCLLLQARTPSAMQKMAIQMIGSAMMIAPDVAVQNSQILGDITTSLTVNQALEDMLDSNTGVYRPRLEKPQGNPEPATATQLRFAQANVLNATQVNRFLKQLDPGYAEMYRRLAASQIGNGEAEKAAKDFQDRCEKRGVPVEALRKPKFVRASRTIGNGSVAMRQQSIQTVGAVAAMLPESGRSAWIDDLIASAADQSKVDRWNPKAERMNMPTDQQDLAMLENAAMRSGAPVTWTPTQNNIIHAQTHLQAGSQAAASLQQGANPADVYSFLEALGPHITKHIQALSIDPTRKGAVQALTKQLGQLSSIADRLGNQLRKQAQEQQKAQQEAAQAMPELQLEAQVQKGKLMLAEKKQDHAMSLKERQAAHKMQLSAAQAQQKMAVSTAEAQQAMVISDAEAAAEIKRKDALAKSQAAATKNDSTS